MVRYELPDTAWELISPLLPPERSQQVGHPYVEHRKIINRMFWVLCSGAPWRDLLRVLTGAFLMNDLTQQYWTRD